jgi:endogenous inhibitor of DNA gyrase (YacG/DUF329 family)
MPAKPPEGAGPGKRPAKGSAKPCPICGKPASEASRPFCSERCRDVDLNRWLSNSYAIPGSNEDDEDKPGGE